MSDLWCYSDNEELFRGRLDTKEAAVQEALDEGLKLFWVGKCDPPSQPEDYWHAYDWLELVSCQDDYDGDWADDWDRSSQEQREELETEVRATMAAWLDRYNLRPTHYNVTEVEKFEMA